MPRPAESVVDGSKAPPKALQSAAAATPAEAKDLPAVDRLLREPSVAALLHEHGHTLVAAEARALLERHRTQARAGQLARGEVALPALSHALERAVQARLAPRLRTVLNLTGTVIHTNLGRALLADAALQHVLAMMAGPNNLEYDLAGGARGDRDSIVEELLCTLTGAEAATVVNNNAGAVLLTIAALARDKEVIVSRGELVEIGGAFRMPDVMAAAGARLVEVGTTNRTHPQDYERAIGAHTALLMKVHTSNYAVQGFTASVDEAELARIAQAKGLPLATDLGSGSLIDLAHYGLPREPTPQEKLQAGCDVVTFSGDKLLGGPQAGLLVGSRAAISRIRQYPLKRALRMSKLPLAALEATLRLYLRPERLAQDLPTLRLLTRPVAAIHELAAQLQPTVARALAPRFAVEVVALMGQIGSGSLPVESLPSAGLAITLASPGASASAATAASAISATSASTTTPKHGAAAGRDGGARRKGSGRALDELAATLRGLPLPVIGRIAEDRLLLDLRCLEQPQLLLAQLPAWRAALGLAPLREALSHPGEGRP